MQWPAGGVADLAEIHRDAEAAGEAALGDGDEEAAWISKFRTMHPDAEARLSELVQLDAPVFKFERDPRVTRVGRARSALP